MNISTPWRAAPRLVACALVAGLTGCAGHRYASAGPPVMGIGAARAAAPDPVSAPNPDETPAIIKGAQATKPDSKIKRLVIYKAQLSLAVFDREKALARARALAEKAGGWMQALSTHRITLRVPAKSLGALLKAVSKIGEVLDRDIRGKDVTQRVFDLEIRLQNALKIRQRLTQLLAQAKSVKDSVLIEKELGRITEKIERFKGELKFLKHHIAHSTLEVGVRLKTASGPRKRKLPFRWLRRLGMNELFERR